MTVDRDATLVAMSRHCRHLRMRLIDGSPRDMALRMTMDRVRAAAVAALLGVAVIAYWTLRPGDAPKPGVGAPRAAGQNAASRDRDGVDLSDSQLASVKVEPVEEREFPVEKDAFCINGTATTKTYPLSLPDALPRLAEEARDRVPFAIR